MDSIDNLFNGPEPQIPTDTKVLGIFQSDIIIRTALIAAIQDLRRDPWLLDYCFASLNMDPLTASQYGAKEIANAKRWFQRTDIPVVMDFRLDSLEGTCISIQLQASEEAENTYGDTHYDPYEQNDFVWPVLAGPFSGQYNPSTGILLLPQSVIDQLIVVPGMVVVSDTGRLATVTDVTNKSQLTLSPALVDTYAHALIKSGTPPEATTQLESVSFKEKYVIGVHTMGDAQVNIWLYSITMYILLRFKEQYLEARGLERTSVAAQGLQRNQQTGKEVMWSRFIAMDGYCRHVWPKIQEINIRSTFFSPEDLAKVNGAEDPNFIPEDNYTTATTPFFAEED